MTDDFEPLAETAGALETAFERTGAAIERALEKAARSGEASFSRMTDTILRDLARLAAERLIADPLTGALENALAGLPFAGARAAGGPVAPGGAYLVGEQGPEVFVPASAGSVEPAGRAITVNIHLAPGSEARAVEASEGRISRALARAVAKGSRHL